MSLIKILFDEGVQFILGGFIGWVIFNLVKRKKTSLLLQVYVFFFCGFLPFVIDLDHFIVASLFGLYPWSVDIITNLPVLTKAPFSAVFASMYKPFHIFVIPVCFIILFYSLYRLKTSRNLNYPLGIAVSLSIMGLMFWDFVFQRIIGVW